MYRNQPINLLWDIRYTWVNRVTAEKFSPRWVGNKPVFAKLGHLKLHFLNKIWLQIENFDFKNQESLFIKYLN